VRQSLAGELLYVENENYYVRLQIGYLGIQELF
jgi:hypothetical protein